MIIWSFDPGANGAFVRMPSNWDNFYRLSTVYRTAKIDAYRGAYRQMRLDSTYTTIAVVEDLNMRLGDLKKSASISEMLKNAGRGIILFEMAGIPIEHVAPKTWQAPYGLLNREYSERKRMARDIAKEWWSDTTLADADAKLIAKWKWHQINNIPFPKQLDEIKTRLTITKEVER